MVAKVFWWLLGGLRAIPHHFFGLLVPRYVLGHSMQNMVVFANFIILTIKLNIIIQ